MNYLVQALVVSAVLLISSIFSYAESGNGFNQVLTSFEFTLIGVGLKASPEYQAVPKGIATKVAAALDAGSFSSADIIDQLPTNYTVRAELSGPAFQTPVSLVTRPGAPFDIPTLAVLGRYTLANIRLVDGDGVTLFGAAPQAVAIESIPDPLITNVTTRQLTLQDLQERGITFDKSNFTAYEFTAGIATSSGQVPLSLPVLLPTSQTVQNTPEIDAPATLALPQPTQYILPPEIPETVLPQNLEIAPFMMEVQESFGDVKLALPPIPGVIVIPGNIGFLHQYFSALVLVANGAPLQSGLSIRDVTARISFPAGEDLSPGTDSNPGDDPLRMAKGANGFLPRTMPVMGSGADGKAGTADDGGALQSGESGQADFTIEGLKEGTHKIDFALTAILEGLPVGPVTLKGTASGAVLVRNPDFTVTLGHPATVRAGEQYDLFVIVTNTGKSVANMITVGLDPRALSGAVFVAGEASTKSITTILPGSAGTVKFRLTSQRTGAVTATAFESPEVRGKFILRAGVGEKNIPLSPDSLILPYTSDLPADLVTSAVGLLGQAWSVATAPAGALPPDILAVTKAVVTSRAYDLSEAGLRVLIGDSLVKAVEDLTFDFYGSDVYHRGFDSLRRFSTMGLELNRALGAIFQGAVAESGALPFQAAFADKVSSRPAHLSILSSSAPVRLLLTDSAGNRTGALTATSSGRGIPYADSITLEENETGRTNLILATRLASPVYNLELAAEGAGVVDLGIVLPDAGGVLTQYVFAGVAVTAGARGTLILQPGTAEVLLSLDDNGDGVIDRTLNPSAVTAIPDHAPHIVAATQLVPDYGPGGDKHGRNVAVLFSERISKESAQNSGNYAIEENLVKQSVLQPGGRMAFLLLRDGIGPFAAHTLTVQGLVDQSGKTMNVPETLPIRITAQGPAAVVSGTVRTARGEPVPNATIRLYQLIWYDDGYTIEARYALFTEKQANPDGSYRLEYVLQNNDPAGPFQLEAVNPTTGEIGSLTTGVMYHGQRLTLDIFMKAKGSLSGVVRDEAGNPVGEATVQVRTLTDERYQTSTTDATGTFSFNELMVGAYSLKAVNQATYSEGSAMGTLPENGAAVTQDVTIRRLATTTRGTVAGKIFAGDGVTPRGGLMVIIDAPSFKNWQRSAGDGSYRFTDVYPGSMTVNAMNETTGECSMVGGTLTDGGTVFMNVIMKGTGSVTGSVKRDDGKSAEGLYVVASYALKRVLQTDAQGSFRFDDIPLGTVSISIIDPRDFNRTVASGSVNVLSAGDVAVIALYVPAKALATGIIQGTVYHRDGAPWANAPLRQLVDDTHYYLRQTDAAGKFSIPNLALGNYRLALVAGAEVINVVTDLWYDTQVRSLELRPVGLGTVTGTTWDDAGKTLPTGAEVTFYSTKPNLVGWLTYDTDRPTMVKSDPQSGRFTFNKVLLGSFNVSSSNIFRPAPVAQSGELKTDGQVVNVDLALKGVPVKPGDPSPVNQPGSVSGRVLLPDGTAVGEQVRITVTFGGTDVTVATDSQGMFRFSAIIPAGNQTIRAEDPATTLKWQGNVSIPSGLDVPLTIKLLGRGSLEVTVLNADGTPATEVSVAAGGIEYPNDSASGKTDAHGLISFLNLSEGLYALSASGTFGRGGGAQAIIPGDKANMAIVVRLAASAMVTGRFLKADGVTPIAGGQITLKRNGQAIAYASSSSDPADLGRFTLLYVPLGDFSLEGHDPVTERHGMGGGHLATDQETVTADVVVTPRGSVTGIVLNNSGAEPIPGAAVAISVNGVTGFNYTSVTAPDGTFFFTGVPAGRFTVDAADPSNGMHGQASGMLSYENETVQTQVRVAPTGSIIGKVLLPDGVTPATTASVRLNGRLQQVDSLTGAYRYDDLAAGSSYTISASQPTTRRNGSTVATIAGDLQVANGDIILSGVGTVTGTILESDGTTILQGARIELRFKGELLLAYSAGDGSFMFTDIPTGAFTLTVSHPERTTGASQSSILPSEGAMATVNLILGPVASVKATVLLADGATPSRGGGIRLTVTTNGLILTGITDSNGQYIFSGIPVPGTISLSVEDAAGVGIGRAHGVLTQNGEVLDLGTITLDDKPIFVIAVNPSSGAVTVPVNQELRVLFSEPAAPDTLNLGNIYLTQGSSRISGVLTPDADNRGITFKPSEPLQSFTLYTLVVKDDVTDLVGRKLALPQSVSFTTIDTIPPVLTAISPANGVVQAAADTVVRLSFSEALDVLSLSGITLSSGETTIPVKVELIRNGTVVALTPAVPLDYNRSYTVAASGVRDSAGNVMIETLQSSFATIDTRAPTITNLTMPAGSDLITGNSVQLTAFVAESDVAFIDFFVEELSIGSVTKAPFTLPVTLPKEGLIHFKAIAQDKVGNRGVAALLDIQVSPDQVPVVSIVSPDNESTLNTGAPFTVTVQGSDDLGITAVTLSISGSMDAGQTKTVTVGKEVSTSFTFMAPVSIGQDNAVVLTAVATDSHGALSRPASRTLLLRDTTAPTISLNPGRTVKYRPGEIAVVNLAIGDNMGANHIVCSATGATTATRTFDPTPQTTEALAFSFTLPAGALPYAEITVSCTAYDTAGNNTSASLILVVADVVPPTVVSVSPANSSTKVPTTAVLTLVFSETLDPTSVTAELVSLTSSSGPVPGTLTVAGDGLSLTFKPFNQLGLSRTYTFTLKAGVRDISGNAIASDMTLSFTTQGPDSDLVGYWQLDGNWNDSSGKGHHGTPVNGVIFSSEHVVGTQAGSFRNGSGYVSVGNLYGNFPDNTFSIETWVKLDDTGNGGRRTIAGAVGSWADYALGIIENQFTVYSFYGSTGYYAKSGFIPEVGRWYHVAGAFDGGRLKLYINGELTSDIPAAWGQNGVEFRIGNESCCGNNVNGLIDDVALYKRALLAEDIFEHYNAGLTTNRISPKAPTVEPVAASTYNNTILLHGSKDAGTSIRVNGRQIIAHDANTTWQTLFPLSLGQNLLDITSHDRAGTTSIAVSVATILLSLNGKDQTIVDRSVISLSSPGQTVNYRPGESGIATITVTNPDGIVKLYCIATGAAGEGALVVPFDPPLTDITRQFTFRVASDAVPYAPYRLSCIAETVAGTFGISTLDLQVADLLSATVTGASIANNAKGVIATQPITVTFNETMLAASISSDTVLLRRVDTGSVVAGTRVLSPDGRTITFTPTTPLECATSYQFVIHGVSDLAGNSSDYSINFSTQPLTSLMIENKGVSAAPYILAAGRYGAVTVINSFVVLDGPIAADSMSVSMNSTITHRPTTLADAGRLDLVVTGALSIDATSKVDVSARGYLGAYQGGNDSAGRTNGNTATGGSTSYSGGSYGGYGGYYSGAVNAVYGDPLNPNESGSGGGGDSGSPGGNGGGLVRITAGAITLDGSIVADGQTAPSGYYGGGGSGGGIRIDAGAMSGGGFIYARGGGSPNNRGSGGGGRIAIYFGTLTLPQANVIASGAGTSYPGGAGAIYLKADSAVNGDMVVAAAGRKDTVTILPAGNYGTISITNATVITDGPVHATTVLLQNAVVQITILTANVVSLTSSSVLTQTPTSTTTESHLDLNIGTLSIDATSKIDVSARGYPGAYQSGNGSAGRTNGNTATGGSTSYSGGSYGGYGGYYSGAVNAVYGDPLNPNESGSGGGGDSGSPGGNGGGLVRITAGAITLDGSIVADGQTAPSGYYGGGGSGGGIRIDAGTMSGAGVIYARGGGSPNNRGSGGGGRIAIYSGTLTLPEANVIASGAGTSYSGGAGTVYLKSTTLDTDHLIVDNRAVNSGEGSTPLRAMGSGVVFDVTTDTLTTSGASWQPGALKGLRFAPDVTLNRYFTVIDNDATSLRIDPAEGDLTTATDRGLTFGGVHAFTKVSILGKGRLTSLDRFAISSEVLVDGSTLVTTAISTDRLTLRKGSLLSQWRATTGQEYKLDLSINTLLIDTSSMIDVTGRGYLGAYQSGNGSAGRTNGNTATGGSASYSGGSYGGSGGYYSGAVNAVYGNPLNPNQVGSGGGGDSGSPGGNGGGLVRITAGAITLDGSIIADGQTAPSGYYGGGGSGGGIRIDAGAMSGGGFIYARGGGSPNNRGSGGGGRIAIYSGTLTLPQANVITSGAGTSYPGGAGTIYLKADSAVNGDMVVAAAGRKDAVTILPTGNYGIISVTDSTLTTDGPVHAATVLLHNAVFQITALTADIVSLTGNSVLTQPPTSTTTESQIDLVTGALSIDASSKIDVNARGYLGAYQGGNSSAGRTNGNTSVGGSTSYSGGSYGGYGGYYSGAINAAYGDLLNPNESGSGGGGDSGSPGGNGGGLVRIMAGTIALDGSIIADGQTSPSGYYGGGGSGGGIKIDTGALSGAGFICARGGGSPNNRGSGGGGRIAIYSGTLTLPQANVIASGGGTSYPGGAGTIYLKSTTLGTDHLIVDNRAVNSGEGSTPLRAMGTGVVSDVTTDTLTTSGVSWQPGALKGLLFAPDTTQSRYFTVIDNDATSLRIDPAEGDLTTATDRGLPFSGVYAFTKVSILGKGRLTSLDRFAVSSEVLVDGSTLVTTAISANLLTLRTGSLLSQWRTTTSREYRLDLLAGALLIDASSRIDVTGRGYLGAYQGGNGSAGRTKGNTAVGGSTGYSGGSYGGYGGYYSGMINALYGDLLNPNESGSGGSGDSGSPGGNGGGLVRITTGTLTLDGAIVADGQTAPSGYYGGGGSGGGIRIDAGALSGAGFISTRGGGSPNNRGGGGGGRIAIYSNMLTLPATNVTASGGGGSYSGKNGGIYVSP